MNIVPTDIPDILIIEPQVFEDECGFFLESYNEKTFAQKAKAVTQFVQDNHSRSTHNVVRGLGYQVQQPQGKLVRVVFGTVFDVAVDLRKSSPTFGQWVGILLSAENRRQLWIPEGFAHGFLAISDVAEVVYKTTNYYAPQYDRCIIWNDPDLGVAWSLTGNPVLSARDQAGVPFKEAEVFL